MCDSLHHFTIQHSKFFHHLLILMSFQFVWLSFFCGTQKDMFWRMSTLLFSIQQKHIAAERGAVKLKKKNTIKYSIKSIKSVWVKKESEIYTLKSFPSSIAPISDLNSQKCQISLLLCVWRHVAMLLKGLDLKANVWKPGSATALKK